MRIPPAVPGGHGHVYPRKDRGKARCGGPKMCKKCASDMTRAQADGYYIDPPTRIPPQGTGGVGTPVQRVEIVYVCKSCGKESSEKE
ncbi:hypothetical protein SEA_JUMBO_78 [Gordonia phage Jumbo]|uniref:Uncharacterized protein n=1 Tax=Gordonia phage Jumbo TaxID=1887650 RepID=A0A1B3B0T9_9CAUD|nr:hypothetical protein BIZ69_gp078 [Gordonia phage Jumbo]AOE44586.1 hypothetical protein SEA_JUMBO_78 [Gordonia phage Jumbo]